MSTTVQPQAVAKTLVGNCESHEIKGDWHHFHIRHEGSQYPLKLSTKKPELVQLASNVGQQLTEWGYLESQGNENPNRPGTHYMNRYLTSAVVLDQDRPQLISEAITDERRQELIVRQSCLKAAVDRANQQAGATDVLLEAERYVAWVWQKQPARVSTDVLSPDFEPDDVPF